MTTYSWPSLSVSAPHDSIKWWLESNNSVLTSPLTGDTQTVEHPGAKWRCSFVYDPLLTDDAGKLRALLAKLRGQSNRVLVPYFPQKNPRGVALGGPFVAGGPQVGEFMVTGGWVPNVSGILRAGDFVKLGNELKMVVEDANSNASGLATILIEPPQRVGPVNGSGIIIAQPTCLMMLATPRGEWTERAGNQAGTFTAIPFDLVEAFS